ncbi:MAG TPA: HEAT repeat domain-containing protein [Candidatus Acidoferrum sp.]|nr:HEAT repeat domain-containing protein [Candidatus Acidoferrum sp.]
MKHVDRGVWSRVLALSGIASLLGLCGISARKEVWPSIKSGQQTEQSKTEEVKKTPSPSEKAWTILREALKEQNVDKRTRAVHALGLLPGSVEAEKSAVVALKDEKPNVRVAAAAALGSMKAEDSKGDLEAALGDSEPSVVLASANSLLLLHDDVGYDTYYEVLTGERRASKGLIKEQLDTFKDKKKVAQLGFEEGIGFIPFAGIGYEVFKTVTKNDSSPVRAAAAKQLAHDPGPDAADALVKAAADKQWQVRAAALEAIALRGDQSLIPKISAALDDDKDVVRLTAAACVAHLSALPENTKSPNP